MAELAFCASGETRSGGGGRGATLGATSGSLALLMGLPEHTKLPLMSITNTNWHRKAFACLAASQVGALLLSSSSFSLLSSACGHFASWTWSSRLPCKYRGLLLLW